jgi:hypothetical protein
MRDWMIGIALAGIAFWLFVLVPFSMAWALGKLLGAS